MCLPVAPSWSEAVGLAVLKVQRFVGLAAPVVTDERRGRQTRQGAARAGWASGGEQQAAQSGGALSAQNGGSGGVRGRDGGGRGGRASADPNALALDALVSFSS
jgi:hypothetical protein